MIPLEVFRNRSCAAKLCHPFVCADLNVTDQELIVFLPATPVASRVVHFPLHESIILKHNIVLECTAACGQARAAPKCVELQVTVQCCRLILFITRKLWRVCLWLALKALLWQIYTTRSINVLSEENGC